MDNITTPKRVQSIRRHAAFVSQVRRDTRRNTHNRRSNVATATNAVIRRSIIDIMSTTEQGTDLAANELAEAMDSAFFPKSRKHPSRHTTMRYADTGFPSKCVTVLDREYGPGQSSPSKGRRRPLAFMDKLKNHRPQRSLPSPSPRKPSVDTDVSMINRSLLARLSRAVLRRRPSVTTPNTSPRKHGRSPSTLSSFKQTISISPSKRIDYVYPDHLSPSLHTPMLDATFEQIIHAKHDLGAPKIDSAHHAYVDDSFRDSAYWSKASDDTANSPIHSVDTNKFAADIRTKIQHPHLSPRKNSSSTTSPSKRGQLLPAIQFDHDSSLSQAPPHTLPVVQRPPLLHSASAPILRDAPLPRPRLQTAVTTPSLPSASRPRFERFLSTASIFTEGSMTASPTTSKPPSPLRDRPYLDTKSVHRRRLSNGSVTAEIKIFLDDNESSDEEDEDIRVAVPPPRMFRPKPGVRKVEKNKKEVAASGTDQPKLSPDEAACHAFKALNTQTMNSGHASLANSLFRQTLANTIDDSSESEVVTPNTPPQTLLTLPSKAFKPAIHNHPKYPDVPYTPHPSEPGRKWYDEYATAQSPHPTWVGQYVRGRDYDVTLARGFESCNFTQASVAKRVLRGRVVVDDGVGFLGGGFSTPLEEAMESADRRRKVAETVARCVRDLKKLEGDLHF